MLWSFKSVGLVSMHAGRLRGISQLLYIRAEQKQCILMQYGNEITAVMGMRHCMEITSISCAPLLPDSISEGDREHPLSLPNGLLKELEAIFAHTHYPDHATVAKLAAQLELTESQIQVGVVCLVDVVCLFNYRWVWGRCAVSVQIQVHR